MELDFINQSTYPLIQRSFDAVAYSGLFANLFSVAVIGLRQLTVDQLCVLPQLLISEESWNSFTIQDTLSAHVSDLLDSPSTTLAVVEKVGPLFT